MFISLHLFPEKCRALKGLANISEDAFSKTPSNANIVLFNDLPDEHIELYKKIIADVASKNPPPNILESRFITGKRTEPVNARTDIEINTPFIIDSRVGMPSLSLQQVYEDIIERLRGKVPSLKEFTVPNFHPWFGLFILGFSSEHESQGAFAKLEKALPDGIDLGSSGRLILRHNSRERRGDQMHPSVTILHLFKGVARAQTGPVPKDEPIEWS
jgi:hypothetical protein